MPPGGRLAARRQINSAFPYGHGERILKMHKSSELSYFQSRKPSPMRKQIVPAAQQQLSGLHDHPWLDLERLANVELTSEDPEHPIESALLPENESGWRAAEPGEQTIRLIFNSPQPVQRIRVEVIEPLVERTQEYVLRWSADGEKSFREIVRQQWNFNPGATHQIEDYRVDLPNASVIELTIIPDTSGGDARASLARLLLA